MYRVVGNGNVLSFSYGSVSYKLAPSYNPYEESAGTAASDHLILLNGDYFNAGGGDDLLIALEDQSIVDGGMGADTIVNADGVFLRYDFRPGESDLHTFDTIVNFDGVLSFRDMDGYVYSDTPFQFDSDLQTTVAAIKLDVSREDVITFFTDGTDGYVYVNGEGLGSENFDETLIKLEGVTAPLHLWQVESRQYGSNDADSIAGFGISDSLRGNEGHDVLNGLDGHDRLRGQQGDDQLNGGEDFDTAEYQYDPNGIQVSANEGTVIDGWGNTDTLTSIEHIKGTRYDDDFSLNENGFSGQGVTGRYEAGDGWDSLFYHTNNGGVLVNGSDNQQVINGVMLQARTAVSAVDVEGGTDYIYGFEGYFGSDFSDYITVSGVDQFVRGQGGADTITVVGEASDVMIDFRAGESTSTAFDTIDIRDGNDDSTLLRFRNMDGYSYHEDAPYAYQGSIDSTLNAIQVDGTVDNQVLFFTDGADGYLYVKGSGEVDVSADFNDTLVKIVGATDPLPSWMLRTRQDGSDLEGSAMRDYLRGTSGDDYLRGGAENDYLRGKGGNDTLDGGDGFDRAEYHQDTAGIYVNLTNNTVHQDADGSVDTLISIEHIRASNHDDYFNASVANGFKLEGRGGWDMVSYGDYNQQIVVNTTSEDINTDGQLVESGRVFKGLESDQLVSISNIRGTDFDDTFVLGGQDEAWIDAGAGNDTIVAKGAGATVIGGEGADEITLSGSGWTNPRYYGSHESNIDGFDTIHLPTEGYSDFRMDLMGMKGYSYDEGLYVAYQTSLFDTVSAIEADSSYDNQVLFFTDNTDGYVYVKGVGSNPDVNFDGLLVRLSGQTDPISSSSLRVRHRGDDEAVGTNMRDRMDGTFADNYFSGGEGKDQFTSSEGFDTYIGGEGFDVARYYPDSEGIYADLRIGAAIDSWGDVDKLIDIEGITGSYQRDMMVGNNQNNHFSTLSGDDVVLGGAGHDSVDYFESADAIRVNLSTQTVEHNGESLQAGRAVGYDASVDTLHSIEGVYGSFHDDVVIGSTGLNFFKGRGGNDYFDGQAGYDRAAYGGKQADYEVITDGQTTTVKNIITDETDTLRNVELLEFADATSVITDSFHTSINVKHWHNAGAMGEVMLSAIDPDVNLVQVEQGAFYSESSASDALNFSVEKATDEFYGGVSAQDALLALLAKDNSTTSMSDGARKAADVDLDNQITNLDISAILDHSTGKQSLTGWKFFEEGQSDNSFVDNHMAKNYTGVLLGDVNGSAAIGSANELLDDLEHVFV